jgi:hypothetical protein
MVCPFVLNVLLDKELVIQDAIIIVNSINRVYNKVGVSCTDPEKNM